MLMIFYRCALRVVVISFFLVNGWLQAGWSARVQLFISQNLKKISPKITVKDACLITGFAALLGKTLKTYRTEDDAPDFDVANPDTESLVDSEHCTSDAHNNTPEQKIISATKSVVAVCSSGLYTQKIIAQKRTSCFWNANYQALQHYGVNFEPDYLSEKSLYSPVELPSSDAIDKQETHCSALTPYVSTKEWLAAYLKTKFSCIDLLTINHAYDAACIQNIIMRKQIDCLIDSSRLHFLPLLPIYLPKDLLCELVNKEDLNKQSSYTGAKSDTEIFVDSEGCASDTYNTSEQRITSEAESLVSVYSSEVFFDANSQALQVYSARVEPDSLSQESLFQGLYSPVELSSLDTIDKKETHCSALSPYISAKEWLAAYLKTKFSCIDSLPINHAYDAACIKNILIRKQIGCLIDSSTLHFLPVLPIYLSKKLLCEFFNKEDLNKQNSYTVSYQKPLLMIEWNPHAMVVDFLNDINIHVTNCNSNSAVEMLSDFYYYMEDNKDLFKQMLLSERMKNPILKAFNAIGARLRTLDYDQSHYYYQNPSYSSHVERAREFQAIFSSYASCADLLGVEIPLHKFVIRALQEKNITIADFLLSNYQLSNKLINSTAIDYVESDEKNQGFTALLHELIKKPQLNEYAKRIAKCADLSLKINTDDNAIPLNGIQRLVDNHEHYQTPLVVAVAYKNSDMVNFLLDQASSPLELQELGYHYAKPLACALVHDDNSYQSIVNTLEDQMARFNEKL